MKKVLTLTLLPLFLLLASGFLYACSKKENHVAVNEPSPVPSELVGNLWMYGTFSPTEVWDKNNITYMGNAFELAVAFQFNADGTYIQYFTAGGAGNCGSKAFVMEKGNVKIDAIAKTFTTTPTFVRNKQFICGSTSETQSTSGLTGHTYYYNTGTTSGSTPILEIKAPGASTYTTFRKI